LAHEPETAGVDVRRTAYVDVHRTFVAEPPIGLIGGRVAGAHHGGVYRGGAYGGGGYGSGYYGGVCGPMQAVLRLCSPYGY